VPVHASKAYRGIRGITPLILNLETSTIVGGMWSASLLRLFTLAGKVTPAEWATQTVWKFRRSEKSLALAGVHRIARVIIKRSVFLYV